MLRMSFLGFILAIIATPALFGSAARADVYYPWCAYYTNGGVNCGFTSQAQCRATVSGIGGDCVPNSPPAGRRRR